MSRGMLREENILHSACLDMAVEVLGGVGTPRRCSFAFRRPIIYARVNSKTRQAPSILRAKAGFINSRSLCCSWHLPVLGVPCVAAGADISQLARIYWC